MTPPFPRTEAEYRALVRFDETADWVPTFAERPCQCTHGLLRHERRGCRVCSCRGWRDVEQLGAGL